MKNQKFVPNIQFQVNTTGFILIFPFYVFPSLLQRWEIWLPLTSISRPQRMQSKIETSGLLEVHLRTRTFLVDKNDSLAIITISCIPLCLNKWFPEPPFHQAFQISTTGSFPTTTNPNSGLFWGSCNYQILNFTCEKSNLILEYGLTVAKKFAES